MRHSHGSVDILLRESGGLLEHGKQSVPHIFNCIVASLSLRMRCERQHFRRFLRLLIHPVTPLSMVEARPLPPGMR